MAILRREIIYECDNACGMIGPWDVPWRHVVVAKGKGYAAWEEVIHLCSQKCEDEWREKNGMKKAEGGE